jgi:cytoskeletal protein CcmA (bactofilin family)
MWNRRKDDDLALSRPAAQQPAPVEPKKESIAMTPTSGRIAEPFAESTRGGTATLGKSVYVKGQISSREDLTIDGEVEGSIELPDNRLTIGPHGKVTANIKAREIVVLGTVNGNMDVADKIDIRREAKLVGDIRSARIVVEDGAYFKGSIDIVKPEPPKVQPPKPQPAPQAQAAAAGQAQASAPSGPGGPARQ